jgi:hypothetical protein
VVTKDFLLNCLAAMNNRQELRKQSLTIWGPIVKMFTRNALAVLFATLLTVAAGHSQDKNGRACGFGTGHACADTPEINPAMGAGALAFIGGVVMVIRGRRKA